MVEPLLHRVQPIVIRLAERDVAAANEVILSTFWLPGPSASGNMLSYIARASLMRRARSSSDFGTNRTTSPIGQSNLKPGAQTAGEFHQNCGRPNWPMLMDNRRKRLADESKGQGLT